MSYWFDPMVNTGYGYGGPAMSAGQINSSMGLPGAQQSNQAALNSNFGNFGQQTDYYSALGAAYGRATGGFGGGFGAGAPAREPGEAEWQYNQRVKGGFAAVPAGNVTRGNDLPAPDTSSYNPLTGTTWGQQSPVQQSPGPGSYSPSPNYPGGTWQPGGAAAAGMPEWQYNQMMRGGGGGGGHNQPLRGVDPRPRGES